MSAESTCDLVIFVVIRRTRDLVRGLVVKTGFAPCNLFGAASQTGCLAILVLIVSFADGWAEGTGRIKRPPPTFEEQQGIAAETAKNDGLLRQGDIIVTKRGFLVFKGVADDGFTNQFETIPNPLSRSRRN